MLWLNPDSTITRTPGTAARISGQRLEPVHPGHGEVEQHEVGLQLGGQLHGGDPVGGLPHDGQPVVGLHPGPQQHPQVLGVVDDQDAVRALQLHHLLLRRPVGLGLVPITAGVVRTRSPGCRPIPSSGSSRSSIMARAADRVRSR